MSAAASRSRTDMDVIPSNHSDIPICSCFVLCVKRRGFGGTFPDGDGGRPRKHADSVLVLGDRNAEAAAVFTDDLASRFANRVLLTTDGHKAYLDAVGVALSRGPSIMPCR